MISVICVQVITSFFKIKKMYQKQHWRKITKMVSNCISMYSSLFVIYTEYNILTSVLVYFFIFHSVGGTLKSWHCGRGRSSTSLSVHCQMQVS